MRARAFLSEGRNRVALPVLLGLTTTAHAATGIIAWGLNDHGQCTVPNDLTNVVAVSAGQTHAVALLGDGTVKAWGDNTYGQITVPLTATNMRAVSAGGGFTLALRTNGTVIGWGANTSGQSTIPAGLTNVIAISAGSSHALALRQNGTVVAWGNNSYDQTSVPPGLNNVVEIGAGFGNSLVRRADGSLHDWGTFYSLNYVPYFVTNTISTAAGGLFDAVINTDGTIVTWGHSFVQFVPEGLTNATRLKAGYLHILALKSDRTLAAWGDNSTGAAQTPYGLTNVQEASAGYYFNLAINDGAPVLSEVPQGRSVYSGTPVTFTVASLGLSLLSYRWQHDGSDISGGTNASLVLANPQTSDAGSYTVTVSNPYGSVTSPVAILAVTDSPPLLWNFPLDPILPPGWQTIFTPLLAGGSLPVSYQWRFKGIPIPGATGLSLSVTNVQFTNSGIYTLTASNVFGQTISNVLLSVVPRYLAAWGDGSARQTNAPSIARTNAVAMAAGLGHSLILLGDASVSAFGSYPGTNLPPYSNNLFAVAAHANNSLAVGIDGTLLSSVNQTATPAALPGTRAIALGSAHGLALLFDRSVIAWGNNSYGQTNLPAGITNVISVCAGDTHGLALRQNGTVAAWGTAILNDATRFIPYSAPPNLSNVVALASGGVRTLALRSDGSVVAWTPQQTNIAPVLQELPALSNAVAIADGGDFSLALRRDGTVKVFGWTSSLFGVTNMPAGLSHVVRIAAGTRHSLAIMDWDGPTSPRTQMTGASSAAVLSFPTVNGKTYTVEYSDSLSAPAWQRLALLAGTGETVRLTNSILSSPQRFYQVFEW
jgi:alpha-tubulin suppressor-like RCC1 family protein